MGKAKSRSDAASSEQQRRTVKKHARARVPAIKRKSPVQVDWRPAFLAAYCQLGNITQAAKAANISRSLVFEERKRNSDFEDAFLDSRDEAADHLETEARRRAVEGVEEPVFGSLGAGADGKQKGTGVVGNIRRYSDTLLIFLLKGLRPEKYRENYNVNHAGRADSTVSVPQLEAAIVKVYGGHTDPARN